MMDIFWMLIIFAGTFIGTAIRAAVPFILKVQKGEAQLKFNRKFFASAFSVFVASTVILSNTLPTIMTMSSGSVVMSFVISILFAMGGLDFVNRVMSHRKNIFAVIDDLLEWYRKRKEEAEASE